MKPSKQAIERAAKAFYEGADYPWSELSKDERQRSLRNMEAALTAAMEPERKTELWRGKDFPNGPSRLFGLIPLEDE